MIAASMALGLLLAACDTPVQQGTIDTQPQAPQAPRLQAGDKIRVTVFGEPSLSGDYEIDPAASSPCRSQGPSRLRTLQRQRRNKCSPKN